MEQMIELTRHNVTPAQFLAYVRAQLKKKSMRDVSSDLDLDYFVRGNDLNFYYHDEPGRPCKAEKSVSRPYEMQTYILNWDGSCYNEICEFEFDDEKTGHGYYYLSNNLSSEPTDENETPEIKEEKTMFPNLTAAVNAHFDEAAEKFTANLSTITTGEALSRWYYRDRMTAAALRIAQETDPAEPLPAKVREKMVSRFTRENEHDRQKYLQQLENAANAPELEDLTVCVEWAKNRTWGANPTATVTVNGSHRYETAGHASGCGYDKESAAIASAMNANAAVLRILYTHAERGGKFASSVYTFAGLPYFDGGCGVSCFRNVFEGCGYEWRDLVHRKTFDSCTLTPANA